LLRTSGCGSVVLINRNEISECAVAVTVNVVMNDASTVAACFSVKYMMDN
jgi:hypothetical protein